MPYDCDYTWLLSTSIFIACFGGTNNNPSLCGCFSLHIARSYAITASWIGACYSYDCDFARHPAESNIVAVGACSWDNDGVGMYSVAFLAAGLVLSVWYTGACLMIVIHIISIEILDSRY